MWEILGLLALILAFCSVPAMLLGGMIAGICLHITWLAATCGSMLVLLLLLVTRMTLAKRGVEERGTLEELRYDKSESLEADEKAVLSMGSPEVPAGMADRVHFTVTAPPTVKSRASFVVDVWAHLEQQREVVIRRAREETEEGMIIVKSKGPVVVVRGTILSVRLSLEDLIVDEPEDVILWVGEIGNATFQVQVPAEAKEGPRRGLALIYADGLRIARVDFVIRVGKQSVGVAPIEERVKRYRTAFASYARQDRDIVCWCIQGIQKALPNLQIFLDVDSLRSGQDWELEIRRVIPSRDVFYLFWSQNARDSYWVEQEWRCALEQRGLDFIDPFPLVSPDEAPPPAELASLHFNDRWLYFHKKKTSDVAN